MPRYALLLFTVLALLLAACGGGSTTPPGTPPDTTPEPEPEPEPTPPGLTLSGTAGGYSGAAAEITAEMQNTGAQVATGTVAADGNFSLVLPDTVEADALISNENYEFCREGSISISPASWQLDNFFVLNVKQGEAVTGTLELSDIGERIEEGSLEGYQLVGFYYAANAVTLSGTCETGAFPSITGTFDMQLQEGWNYVLQTVTEGEFSITAATIESVAELPANLQWEFFPAEPARSTQLRDATPNTVKRQSGSNLGVLTPKAMLLR